MSVIAADVVRTARQLLDRFGLRQDGAYGVADEPCCAVGTLAVAEMQTMFGPEAGRDVDDIKLHITGPQWQPTVERAWEDWMDSEGRDPTVYADGLIDWNDREATAEDVRRFYDWWVAELEAKGTVSA